MSDTVIVVPENPAPEPEIVIPAPAPELDISLIVGELKAQVANFTERLATAEAECQIQKADIEYLRTHIYSLEEKQKPDVIAEPVIIPEPEPVVIPEPEPEPEALPEIEILHEEVPEIEKEVIKRKRFFI